jgi:hypothetical protein
MMIQAAFHNRADIAPGDNDPQLDIRCKPVLPALIKIVSAKSALHHSKCPLASQGNSSDVQHPRPGRRERKGKNKSTDAQRFSSRSLMVTVNRAMHGTNNVSVIAATRIWLFVITARRS